MGLDGEPHAEIGSGYRDGLCCADPKPNSPGRPKEIVAGRRVNVWLDQASVERAEAIGEGNVSAGIRKALTAETVSAMLGTKYEGAIAS